MAKVCYYRDMKLTKRGTAVVNSLKMFFIGGVFGLIIGTAYILQYG